MEIIKDNLFKVPYIAMLGLYRYKLQYLIHRNTNL